MSLEAVGLTVFFGLGVFGLLAYGIAVIARHEQAKLIHARELAAAEHDERLAMIERGMAPPVETPAATATREQALQYSLCSVAGVVAFCAWMSGSTAAWVAAGIIGLACVVGAVYVYVHGSAADSARVGRVNH